MVARKSLQRVLGLVFLAAGCLAPIQSVADATITVDWGQVKRKVDPLSFGINLSRGHLPNTTGNPGYVKGISYAVKKGDGSSSLVRLHSNGLARSWSSNGSWNAEQIKQALTPLVKAGLVLQICIDAGLNSQSTIVTPSAAADLVRIINIESKLDVKYWEVPNEKREITAAAYRDIARAMKAVDPTIQVGGPGWFWMDLPFLTSFARDAQADLDFISFHNYAVGGERDKPDQDVYDSIQKLGDRVRELRSKIDQVSPDRRIPIQWNEYNITWFWESPTSRDPRVRTNKGAVVDALFMVAAVDNGADISNVWNECEDTFGFMTCNGDLYLPAHVFHLFNQYMHGSQVEALSSNPGNVVVMAVKSDAGYSAVLINRSPSNHKASFKNSGGILPETWLRHQIWEDGYTQPGPPRIQDLEAGIVLPAHSVTVLTTVPVIASLPFIQAGQRERIDPPINLLMGGGFYYGSDRAWRNLNWIIDLQGRKIVPTK